MSAMTPDEIRQALQANASTPNGAARNARAEELSAAAEASGDRALLRTALDHQINAYEYSSERPRMLVPFARLLQEYDRDPGAFAQWEVRSLFWQFKWVASAIANSPEISLDQASGWLTEMERRYRLAGYTERPVREAELFLADALADDERAELAVSRWMAAERDGMADCHACEINTQGWFWVRKGDDARAIEVWQPVLAGERVCSEEPHRVLAQSLLPLLRLGRLDEARSHHLRGYRMARGNDSLLRSIGKHIEFCALTGNEPRGLEILAEHATHLGRPNDVDALVEFYGGVLVLLRRLTELGLGDGPAVTHQGAVRSVRELYALLHADAWDGVRRFDARNGNSRASDRFTARIERAPLARALPLGVRSAPLPAARPAGTAAAAAGPTPAAVVAGAAPEAIGFAELVARARAARAEGHPGAPALWAQVAARAAAAPAAPVDAALAADLLEHRALTVARATGATAGDTGPERVRVLFAEARDAQRAAGQPDRAALAQLWLVSAAFQADAEPAELRELLAAAVDAAAALDPTDPLRARRIASAELTRMRVESYLRAAEHDHDQHDVDPELGAGLESLVAATTGTDLSDLAADAEELLARLRLQEGDAQRAVALLASAAEHGIGAGRPWLAVDPLALRAQVLLSLGRPAEAEEAARSAVAHSAEVTDAETHGSVRLTLAEILLRGDEEAVAEAARHALDSAHWFDLAGLAEAGGARARLLLARAYAAAGRTVEAVEVLQSAVADLAGQGEYPEVQARELLGDLLGVLHDAAGAAEQYLLAADVTKGWEDPRPQAHLAQSAADALSTARRWSDAVAAYERALQLRRAIGDNPVSEVRMLRSLAWLTVQGKGQGQDKQGESADERFARARARMDAAVAVLEEATAGEAADEPQLRFELAQTWQQLAQLIGGRLAPEDEDDFDEDEDGTEGEDGTERYLPLTGAEVRLLREEQVELWDRAASRYAGLGSERASERFWCVQGATHADRELGREERAAARLTALVEDLRALPQGAAPDWLLPRAEAARDQLAS
ncbi:tetratricopeptide repeat protein [Streptomyces sp. PvR034]|uniref:tetratricopeptide repeat protein n=1 Tax=Streptomyces sp. PvR034 TaxID=3156401 RepID=UPI003396909E